MLQVRSLVLQVRSLVLQVRSLGVQVRSLGSTSYKSWQLKLDVYIGSSTS